MGHETGLYIEHGEPCTWTATWASGTPDYTTITFVGTSHTATDDLFEANKPALKVPLGMLIGQRLSFHGTATTGDFKDFYYSSTDSRVYHIVDHTFDGSATSIKVVPALKQVASFNSVSGDKMFVYSTGMPSAVGAAAASFTMSTNAATSKEFSNIDQFIGLASFMTLPDTKVELHQHHVIGLGRQPSILQPGRLHHVGGVIEMPVHSPRWLYYSLGREVVDGPTISARSGVVAGSMAAGTTVQPGQTYIDIASASVNVGDYVLISDTTRAPTVYHKQAEEGTGANVYWPDGAGLGGNEANPTNHFESTETSEIRRIVAQKTALSGGTNIRLYVDDPWSFAHDSSDSVHFVGFNSGSTSGSPHVNSDRTITNPTFRLLFSGDTLPSFCLEHSIRNRDVGSYSQEDSSTPGGATDTKQLTRIFRGCKINEWEISATVDAELRYRAIFDALSVYTDTGRLETVPGDRYTAHRMFQNTADTQKNRKVSGIAEGSEKPFMFYNGTIEMFDQTIANIAAFEIRGKTGVELHHVIRGNPVPETTVSSSDLRSTKQVPYGGTRSPAIHQEGREEFEMEVDFLIGDPLLWTEVRSHRQFKGTVGSTGGIIKMHFTKPTSGATGSTPSLLILVDDYVITEAPIPVPDDKGLLRSKAKLRMKNVKIISTDTLFHC